MYRLGHYGAALLCYAPLGLVLADLRMLAVLGGAVSLALASLPDVDQKIPFVDHRGVTHTVGFAIAVGGVLGAAGFLAGGEASLGTPLLLAAFGFGVGFTAIVSHLLADVITPMGITPFWPLSDRHYTLDITRADNWLANYALLGLGVLVTLGVLGIAR
jgi:inner membrane protein